MTIETKFNVGDEIWYFNVGGKWQKNTIYAITTKTVLGNGPNICYVTDTGDEIYEGGAFKNIDEILDILNNLKTNN